jgi:hypothetical protein
MKDLALQLCGVFFHATVIGVLLLGTSQIASGMTSDECGVEPGTLGYCPPYDNSTCAKLSRP